MKYPQDAPRVAALNQFIEDVYGGKLDIVVHELYRAIYMLHYLDRDLFPEDDIIDKVFLLYSMAEALNDKEE